MNELQDGVTYRSNQEAWSAGTAIPFKLDYLSKARVMAAPECAFLIVQFDGTVNSAAGTDASGFDAAKLIDVLRFTDEGGPVIECSGQGLRMNEMIELGDRQVDMATLAAGAADANRKFAIVVPFWLFKSDRPRDTCVRLEHFMEGGQLEIVCGALPTGWDGFTGNIRLFAVFFDGRKTELKSRLVLREQAMTLSEHHYDVYGSLRTAVAHTKLTTTSASSWAAFTTVDSQTLGFPARFETEILRRRYRLQSDNINSNDPIVALTPLALPFVTPDRVQKIGRMPDIATLHLDLGAAPPANSRLFTSVIKDRAPRLGALVAGYASIGDYQAALEAHGHIVSAKGKNVKATQFAAKIARRLPMTIGSGS